MDNQDDLLYTVSVTKIVNVHSLGTSVLLESCPLDVDDALIGYEEGIRNFFYYEKASSSIMAISS